MAATFTGLAKLLAGPRSSATPSPQPMQPSAELLPVREGAWAAWAQRYPAAGASLASDFECRLPDGRPGIVKAVFEDGAWRLACRKA